LKKLDGLAEDCDGGVDFVSINMNSWMDRMYFRLGNLDLPHTRLLQDSNRNQLWSTNSVNDSNTVVIFSKAREPLCVLNLGKDFQKNVTALVSTVRRQVDEILKQEAVSTDLNA
jgi:hypothetical protein